MEIIDFTTQIIVVCILYMLVITMVLLDLCAGIRKAKRVGTYRSSRGLRRTVYKIIHYFNMMLAMTCIDAIQIIACYMINIQTDKNIPLLTVFTILGCIFIGFIELKSIYESNEEKDRAKIEEAAKILKAMLADEKGKEVLTNISEFLNKD